MATGLAASLAIGLAAGAAQAGDWRYNGAEFAEGFHGLVFYEEAESAPLGLACAWRRDGEDAPLYMDDGVLEGQPTTPSGQLSLDISAEIAGGYGETIPEMELLVDGRSFTGMRFEGDLIGNLYRANIPLAGPLVQALRTGHELELRSSLADPWTASLAGASEAVEMLVSFCARRDLPSG